MVEPAGVDERSEQRVDERVDGRAARALRTREAIVDACIALVDEGDLKPTTPRIAERAGVSVRSVFQHFEGLEQLFAAVADRIVDRVSQVIAPIDRSLPLGRRIQECTAQRAVLLEAITPIRRAAAVHGPFSVEITSRVRDGHLFLRLLTSQIFESELATLRPAAAEELLDMLDTAFGWPAWETLRMLNGRSVEQAKGTVEQMAIAAFRSAGFEVEDTRT